MGEGQGEGMNSDGRGEGQGEVRVRLHGEGRGEVASFRPFVWLPRCKNPFLLIWEGPHKIHFYTIKPILSRNDYIGTSKNVGAGAHRTA